jgi:hypothetical protein
VDKAAAGATGALKQGVERNVQEEKRAEKNQ